MDFYTKKWHDYIYSNWKDVISKEYDIFNCGIYEGSNNILEEEFIKYYNRKKQYNNSKKELSSMFLKYEQITLYSYEKEKELFLNRVNKFKEKYQNKLTKLMKFLMNNGYNITKEINSVNFELLALNKVTSNTLKFYSEIRKQFAKFLSDNIDLTKKYESTLNEIGFITNHVTSFLTSNHEYQKFKNNTFYTFIEPYSFHDCKVLKYEENNNQVILELDLEKNRGLRLTIDALTITKIGLDKDENQTNINRILTINDICAVWTHTYENYEDLKNYFSITFFAQNNKFYSIKVDIVANSIKKELFIIEEFLEKYIIESMTYQKNLLKIKPIIGNDLYSKLKDPYNNIVSTCFITSYHYDKDLTLNLRNLFPSLNYTLTFIDAKIKILKNNQEIQKNALHDEIDQQLAIYNQEYNRTISRESFLKIQVPKFSFKKKQDFMEVRILIIETIEILIACSNIKFNYQ